MAGCLRLRLTPSGRAINSFKKSRSGPRGHQMTQVGLVNLLDSCKISYDTRNRLIKRSVSSCEMLAVFPIGAKKSVLRHWLIIKGRKKGCNM